MPGQKFIMKAHGMASTRRATAVRTQATCVLPQGAMLRDCPVEQGTFYGLADQTQTVFMRVKEI